MQNSLAKNQEEKDRNANHSAGAITRREISHFSLFLSLTLLWSPTDSRSGDYPSTHFFSAFFFVDAPAASFSFKYSQSRANRYPYLAGSWGDWVSSHRTVLLLLL